MKKLLFVCVLLMPLSAWSLGLGELVFHSGLNQTADAEIELITAQGEDVPDLKISIAPVSVFEESGVFYRHSLQNLRFSVKNREGNGAFIQVSSKEPVREPVMDFILDVVWTSGHLRRNYSAIINPPAH